VYQRKYHQNKYTIINWEEFRSGTFAEYFILFTEKLKYVRSQSESELLYDWRFTANQLVLTPSPLRPTAINFLFQLNPCGYSPCVTCSLTRGWVCRLELLLDIAREIILGAESRGTHNVFYRLTFETVPTWRARSPYLYPPGTEWSSYAPRHLVRFSSPHTTSRNTVEVFEPASTQAGPHNGDYEAFYLLE
jgi:hypothetical protein